MFVPDYRARNKALQNALFGYLNLNRHKFDERGSFDPTPDVRDFVPMELASYLSSHARGRINLDARCKEEKQRCIEECSDTALPTYTLNGDSFFICINTCMANAGC
jgi:hypothetical protein